MARTTWLRERRVEAFEDTLGRLEGEHSSVMDAAQATVEAGELRLPDGKTGARMVPPSRAAAGVLTALPRDPDNPWVIVGRKPGAHPTNLQHPWRRIRARAGLEDMRIHDLRHSFASRTPALGESPTMIGKLLGHTQVQTTARYAHLVRDSIQNAASRITHGIGGDLLGGTKAQPSGSDESTPIEGVDGAPSYGNMAR